MIFNPIDPPDGDEAPEPEPEPVADCICWSGLDQDCPRCKQVEGWMERRR